LTLALPRGSGSMRERLGSSPSEVCGASGMEQIKRQQAAKIESSCDYHVMILAAQPESRLALSILIECVRNASPPRGDRRFSPGRMDGPNGAVPSTLS
jgi:hypothetical protein